MAARTIVATKAGYINSFLVWEASSSSHFSDSVRLTSTSGSWPLPSPARIRLIKTWLKTSGWALMPCDMVWPPSMLSISPAITSRKRGCSIESLRSVRPSSSGTPARLSCSRWKQKLISSGRGILRPPNSVLGASCVAVTRSSSILFRRISRSTALIASSRP